LVDLKRITTGKEIRLSDLFETFYFLTAARELTRQNKWDLRRIAAQHRANAEYIAEMKQMN
jgi:hypothetical protein